MASLCSCLRMCKPFSSFHLFGYEVSLFPPRCCQELLKGKSDDFFNNSSFERGLPLLFIVSNIT